MALTLLDIERLLLKRGRRSYHDESVSHLRRALQTAALAKRNGVNAQLISASLLHDLGFAPRVYSPLATGRDGSLHHSLHEPG